MFVGGLLTLYAETSLHAGAGAALGVVDLPVQRERHTMFPTVPGTALKGVLRDTARRRVQGASLREANKSDEVVALFGGAAGERDPEAAPEDVAEQSRPAYPAENGDVEIRLGDYVSEWDAVEQARIVELEDEDYR